MSGAAEKQNLMVRGASRGIAAHEAKARRRYRRIELRQLYNAERY